MKVLITAPSLAETDNVSGISSVVRQITAKSRAQFVHFEAGRKDGERIGPGWLISQISLLPRFLSKLKKIKPDLLHINTALTPLSIIRDSVLVFAARRLNYPVLIHIHGGRVFTEGFSRAIFEKLTKQMLGRADSVAVLSEKEKLFLGEIDKNLNVRVLQNAVDLENVISRKYNASRRKTIVFLGRFHKGKGLAEIIKTCGQLKDAGAEFTFKCYGTGDLRDWFVREMSGILGEDFVYGGIVSGSEKWKVLAECDIFFLPSHYEGLPMSLLEAMAAGAIPVVSNVGSIGEVIKDGENGFLVEPENVSQMVEKLKFLLSDELNGKKLQENARSTISGEFEISKNIAKLDDIYSEIAEKRELS